LETHNPTKDDSLKEVFSLFLFNADWAWWQCNLQSSR